MRLNTPILASAFAKANQLQLVGNDQYIQGANEIHNVQGGDLTFVDHPKYYRSTLQSQASVIIIDKVPDWFGALDTEEPPKTLIVASDPFEVYDNFVKQNIPSYTLHDYIDPSADIHPTAIIEPGAVISAHVKIGAHSVVEANACVYGPASIGEHCRIGANSVIGDKAFYFRGISDKGRQRWTSGGGVQLDDYVEIGPNCTIARGVSAITSIGFGSKLDASVMIGHDCSIGKNCLFAAQVGIAGNVTIQDRVTFYGRAGSAQNITIATGCTVLATSIVIKDTEPNQTLNGYPAQESRAWLREKIVLKRLAKPSNK